MATARLQVLALTLATASAPLAQAQAQAAFVEARAHVLDHTPLVAPVAVAGEVSTARLQLRTDAGVVVEGRLVRFTAALADERAWLAPLLHWRVESIDAPRAGGVGAMATTFVAVVLDAQSVDQLPAGATSLRFVESHARAAGRLELVRWSAPVVDEAQRVDLAELPEPLASQAAPLAVDPLRAWRIVALVEERRGAAPGALLLRAPTPLALSEPALRALALQTQRRWGAALRTLALVDQPLARTLRAALVRTVRDEAGRVVAAWRFDPSAEAALLRALLDPSMQQEDKAARARAYLAAGPALVAQLADPAAQRSATGLAPAVCVANLTEEPRVVTLSWEGGAEAAKATVAPRSIRTIQAPAPPPGVDRSRLVARSGSWSAALAAQRQPAQARPPGLRVVGFAPAPTLASWLAGEPSAPGAAARTGLLLQRNPGRNAGWSLYIDAAKAPQDADDRVRVRFGPAHEPIALWTITPDGALVDELAAQEAADAAAGPPDAPHLLGAGADDERWWALAPVPVQAISEDGVLLLAVERIVGADRASAPGPALPWAQGPGSIAVDLRAWWP